MRTGRTGLYHCYDDADELLYIGVSWSFGVRWQKHAATKPWWPDVRRQTIYWYDTRDEALDAEALAIFTEQPRHNVLHRKQAQRLGKIQRRTQAKPAEVSPEPVTRITISPEVTPAMLANMAAIDARFPDDTIFIRPGSGCHAVDWES